MLRTPSFHSRSKVSLWWKDLCTLGADSSSPVTNWFSNSIALKLGSGSFVEFWFDVWIGNTPLRLLFLDVFHLVDNPHCKVADMGTWAEDLWRWNFLSWRRPLTRVVDSQLENIINLLLPVQPRRLEEDGFKWWRQASGFTQTKMKLSDVSTGDVTEDFLPKLRSGGYADVGFRSSMEDVYVCVDHFMQDPGLNKHIGGPSAFYGVFDGHGGKHAADFACNHLPKFILEDKSFPVDIERIVASAFLQTDNAFAEACSLDAALASGTTALATLVIGRLLLVANAGDCRAVLCRNGKAIEMSRDHKPVCMKEQRRIEASGGYVYDGYLNGQLSVTRAIGDWHMEGMKGKDGGPLSAEPELMTTKLTAEDEFLIIGCDGIWDVFRSQNAVDFARRRLQDHNDPAVCSKDLVDEALKRKSGDNLAAVVVCFQQQPPPNLVAPRARVHRSFSAEGLKELQSFLDSLGK